MKSMVYIYLDIDGVLTTPRNEFNKETGNLCFTEESVKVLKHIINKYNGKLIISSSWKEYKTVEYLKYNVFKFYGLSEYIIGKTPDICSTMREEEIESDMKSRNLNLKDILIIDDIKINGDLGIRHLKTGLYDGLRETDLNKVEYLIGN